MSTFVEFRDAVNQQLRKMTESPVFSVTMDKDTIWDTYLGAFPEGTNPMFRERTEHDCSCCKNFIRNVGNVVSIDSDLELVTVWDINIGGLYQIIADAMGALVRSQSIASPFLTSETKYGLINNVEMMESGHPHTWEHFYIDLPPHLVRRNSGVSLGQSLGSDAASFGVLKRSVEELSDESIDIVLELIAQNSLYRGQEHLPVLRSLKAMKNKLEGLDDAKMARAMWLEVAEHGPAVRFKNTVIGTLLVDLSTGVELERAVSSFETKVAPTNYKRSSALITQSMINKANEKIKELGIESSLARRYARESDLTINNVLFADRNSKIYGNESPLDMLTPTKTVEHNFDKVQEISINEFITNVLPSAQSIEAYVENSHVSNLVSLIAPENEDSPNILKWDNNFSLTYNGDTTDAIEERVKREGGQTTGDVCISLAWFNYDDLDIHVEEPSGHTIYYGNRGSRSPSDGMLDIDMNAGTRTSREPVENVVYTNKNRMRPGQYHVLVNNFNKRENVDFGFTIRLVIDGSVTEYHYPHTVAGKSRYLTLNVKQDGTVSVVFVHDKLTSSSISREEWGVTTKQFTKVNMVLLSPNHWDDNEVGNKHYLFMLDGCKNPESARGLYNEFLRNDLTEHRKVFEVLGSKMRVPESDDQLSGIGFSSTKSTSLILKVGGSFNRLLKVVF